MNRFLEKKRFPILAGIPEPVVARINNASTLQSYVKGELVMSKGEPATHFFFHLRGKALIEDTIAEGFVVTLGSAKPGYCYGWPALLPQEVYEHWIVCAEPCDVAHVDGGVLIDLFHEDPKSGLIFMSNLNYLLGDRLNLRTTQLVRVLQSHPHLDRTQAAQP
jgi:CRP-like cAMP-binding protein